MSAYGATSWSSCTLPKRRRRGGSRASAAAAAAGPAGWGSLTALPVRPVDSCARVEDGCDLVARLGRGGLDRLLAGQDVAEHRPEYVRALDIRPVLRSRDEPRRLRRLGELRPGRTGDEVEQGRRVGEIAGLH